MNRAIRRALLLAVVPLTALTIAACAGSDDSGTPTMGNGTTSPAASGDHSTADVEFAQMMIAHHQQAIAMSTLAQARATDPEVKSLAAQIKTAQQPEIDSMTGWLTGWGQPTAQPGGHTMSGMGTMPGIMSDAEMRQLTDANGVDFDRMFTRMMIAHHNGAIQMAGDVLAKTTNPQVKALAQNVVTTQTAEVAQLQKILDRL